MPMDFSDPEFVFHRATRVWGWRRPTHSETFEQYRSAFAQYVQLSDPDEAKALAEGAVFTKFDYAISVPKKEQADAKRLPRSGKPQKKRKIKKMAAAKSRRN